MLLLGLAASAADRPRPWNHLFGLLQLLLLACGSAVVLLAVLTVEHKLKLGAWGQQAGLCSCIEGGPWCSGRRFNALLPKQPAQLRVLLLLQRTLRRHSQQLCRGFQCWAAAVAAAAVTSV